MDQQISNQASAHEATTTQIEPVIYAGFWRRFFAAVIDGVITWPIGLTAGFVTGNDLILNISVSSIVGLIYVSVFDSSEMQATPGKEIMGLTIMTEGEHQRLTFKKALIRYLLKIVSGAVMFLGYLIQPFTGKRQTFHDMIAETIVVKKNPIEIGYFKAFRENFAKIIG